jgi:hypothetical protein
MLRQRLATVFIAAFAAAAGAGVVSQTAGAQPAQIAPGDLQSLRQENQQLRSDLSYYQAAYSALDQGLTEVERVSRTVRDRRTVKQLSRVIRDARATADQYVQRDPRTRGDGRDHRDDRDDRDRRDDRDDRDTRDTRDSGRDTRDSARALSAADFAQLRAHVQAAAFDDAKLALVRSAANGNVFSVEQVGQLMATSSFDDTRIEIAAVLRARVIDPQRWYLVYDALQFESSKATLRTRVGE